jgi:hypothetical protein
MVPRLFKTREGFANWVAAHPAASLDFKPIHVSLLHDDDCEIFTLGCSCRPWYRVQLATPEGLAEGARQQRAWRKSKAA